MMAGPSKRHRRTSPSNDEQNNKSTQKSQQLRRNPPRSSTSANRDVSGTRRPSRPGSVEAANPQDKGAVVYELQSPEKEVSRNSQVTSLRLFCFVLVCIFRPAALIAADPCIIGSHGDMLSNRCCRVHAMHTTLNYILLLRDMYMHCPL